MLGRAIRHNGDSMLACHADYGCLSKRGYREGCGTELVRTRQHGCRPRAANLGAASSITKNVLDHLVETIGLVATKFIDQSASRIEYMSMIVSQAESEARDCEWLTHWVVAEGIKYWQ